MILMGKTNTNEATDGKAVPATQDNTNNKLAVSKKQQELQEAFHFAKQAEGEEITSEYLNFEDWMEGQSEHFVVTGTTEMKNTKNKEGEEMITAIELYNEAGRKLINADAVLVSTCKREIEAREKEGKKEPFLIEVTLLGEKKSSNGKYRDLKIVRKSR